MASNSKQHFAAWASIHPFTHTCSHTLVARCRIHTAGTASGETWRSLSCPTILRHVDCRGQASNRRPSEKWTTAPPPEPRPGATALMLIKSQARKSLCSYSRVQHVNSHPRHAANASHRQKRESSRDNGVSWCWLQPCVFPCSPAGKMC